MAKAKQPQKPVRRVPVAAQPASGQLIVSGRWLLSAFAVMVVLAAIFAYATLGLLFYQGQWQLMLHPARTITTTPHESFEPIRFDYTEEGLPRLSGWWIPADKNARWSGDTILYLHGSTGSLSNYVGDLDALHALGINVFAFDYRGYGKSAGPHPDEQGMTVDANAAWSYLTGTRHDGAKSIVIYGTGVGASLAAELAARQPSAGVVLASPTAPARQVIGSDARAKILPMWLLLTQKFDPAGALKSLSAPKLFLDHVGDHASAKTRTEQLYQDAAQPKSYVVLPSGSTFQQAMTQFLSEVLKK